MSVKKNAKLLNVINRPEQNQKCSNDLVKKQAAVQNILVVQNSFRSTYRKRVETLFTSSQGSFSEDVCFMYYKNLSIYS